MRNPKQTGELTEARVLAELKERDLSVSIPFGEDEKYDMIIDDGEELRRIQIKTCRYSNGSLVFSTRTVGYNSEGANISNYSDGDIDSFVTYYEGNVYEIPFDEAPNSEACIRIEPPKNGQTKGIRFAADYKL